MDIGSKAVPCPRCGGDKRYHDRSFASDYSYVKFWWECDCGASGDDLFDLVWFDTDVDEEG